MALSSGDIIKDGVIINPFPTTLPAEKTPPFSYASMQNFSYSPLP